MQDLHRDREYKQQGAWGDGGEDVPWWVGPWGEGQQGGYLRLWWQWISMDEMQNAPGVPKAIVSLLWLARGFGVERHPSLVSTVIRFMRRTCYY